jgi:hyperosmotically inducible protein
VKKSSAPPNDDTDTTTPSSPPAPNDVVASSDATPAPAPAPDEANANAADTDGRITAQVRSSIATLAPGSNIDVKAMSGIVALAGSVPSQDMVEQARQAAQQVPGVRQVDTSALLVANR